MFPLMLVVKCQVIEGNYKHVEDMKTSSISLELMIQMTLMNIPKKKHSLDNIHSMNEHMIVNSLHCGVTKCNR